MVVSVDRSKLAHGAWGEDRVERWYRDAGYRVLDRNWRVRTGELNGEIDLVVSRNDEIVFCEVKTRRSDRFGSPAEAVGWRKQRRIRALAVEWLRAHDRHGPLRFDVATVVGPRLEVIEGAF